jgi:hypothetical protein
MSLRRREMIALPHMLILADPPLFVTDSVHVSRVR